MSAGDRKSDNSIAIMRADMGISNVIMDMNTNDSNPHELLDHVNTYSVLKKDLTPSIHRKMNLFISKFEKLKKNSHKHYFKVKMLHCPYPSFL